MLSCAASGCITSCRITAGLSATCPLCPGCGTVGDSTTEELELFCTPVLAVEQSGVPDGLELPVVLMVIALHHLAPLSSTKNGEMDSRTHCNDLC